MNRGEYAAQLLVWDFLVGGVLCFEFSARKPSRLWLGGDDRIVKFELTFRNPVTVWVYRGIGSVRAFWVYCETIDMLKYV